MAGSLTNPDEPLAESAPVAWALASWSCARTWHAPDSCFWYHRIWQYLRLLEVSAEQIHQRVFYVGDYRPMALQTWANTLATKLHGPHIRTLPVWIARTAGRVGDAINAAGFRRFPFNSFRLRNVLTEYTFDMSATEAVCGTVPHSLDEAAEETARWFMALEP